MCPLILLGWFLGLAVTLLSDVDAANGAVGSQVLGGAHCDD